MSGPAPAAEPRFRHNEGDSVRVPKLARLTDRLAALESAPVELSLFVEGSPGDAARLMRFASRRDMVLDEAQTLLDAGTEAAAECVFTLSRDGAAIGTITVGAAAGSGTVAIADPGLPAGSVLELLAPSPQDPALADISISIGARR